MACCRALRALHFSGTDNMEQAITWIMEHENDPDLDQPLLLPEVTLQALTSVTPIVQKIRTICQCSTACSIAVMAPEKTECGAVLLQVKEKPKLSAEEARKQAEEVLRKAKEKREVRVSPQPCFLRPGLLQLHELFEQTPTWNCSSHGSCETFACHVHSRVGACAAFLVVLAAAPWVTLQQTARLL